MGSEWKQVRLGDHVDSCLGKMLDKEKNRGSLYPYLGNKNVRWGSFDLDDLNQMRFEDHEHERYGLKYGDLVVCEGGEPGRCAIWKDQVPNMKIQKALHRVRPLKELDNLFLHYWFLWAGKTGALEPFFTGTTIKHLTGRAISELKVPLPPLQEQRPIAHVLGTLDDKIELNRQMNTTLEAMAQALFKSWFVDFDPVIDNALAAGNPIPEELAARAERRAKAAQQPSPEQPHTLPAAIRQQFPDRFMFTETMGWVPEGWRLGCFGDFAKHVRANVKAEDIAGDDLYVGLEHIGRKQIFLSEHGLGESVDSNKSKFEKDDVLFGKLRPYFHKVCIAPSDGICSTDILVLRAKAKPLQSYMVLTAYTEEFVEYANLRSTGTRMPRASAKDLLQYPAIIPPTAVLTHFESTVAPIWAKGTELVEQSRSLTQLRDTLLPKLLSGQLRIPEAEQLIDEVI